MADELDKLSFVEAAEQGGDFVRGPEDYVILFKGNSITMHGWSEDTIRRLGWDYQAGMAASSPEKDYVHLFAHELQRLMPERRVRIIIGKGGRPELSRQGLVAERVFAPDLVVLQNGEHSAYSPAVDGFEAAHRQLVREVREYFPAARVVSIGIWNPRCREEFTSCTAPDYDECAKRIEEIQRRVAAEFGIAFAAVSPYENDSDNTGNGKTAGVRWHPNDQGMKCYAAALLQAFTGMN